jgi:hypothetical protein
MKEQRSRALKEALETRAVAPNPNLRILIHGLISEIRALEMSIYYASMSETNALILETLIFYADPETYFAVGIFPDPPCGEFMNDFSDTDMGFKPGRQARAALDALKKQLKASKRQS